MEPSSKLPHPQVWCSNQSQERLESQPSNPYVNAVDDTVFAFLSQLEATPISSKHTKQISFASKRTHNHHISENANDNNSNSMDVDTDAEDNQCDQSETQNGNRHEEGETHESNRANTHVPKMAKPTSTLGANMNRVNQRDKTNMKTSHKPNQAPHVAAAAASKKTKVHARRDHHHHHRTRTHRKPEQSASHHPAKMNKSSSSKPSSATTESYSWKLQIKNAECDTLKAENTALTREVETLREETQEFETCKTQLLSYEEKWMRAHERTARLEQKLEACGIDPIALKMPEFMDDDTQKNIIFWRERLYKARQKMSEYKHIQTEVFNTANYCIQQLKQ